MYNNVFTYYNNLILISYHSVENGSTGDIENDNDSDSNIENDSDSDDEDSNSDNDNDSDDTDRVKVIRIQQLGLQVVQLKCI